MIFFKLFYTFFKIGLFTIGGGYAMLPLIQEEVINNGWLPKEEIVNFIAVSESTPGPIAINSATFVGYKVCGFWGSFFATLGTVLPSFCIIFVISFLLEEFKDIKAVEYAFQGIRAGVLALLLKAIVTMYKKCPKNLVSYIVMAASFILTALLDLPVLAVLIGCAVFGLITALMAERRAK